MKGLLVSLVLIFAMTTIGSFAMIIEVPLNEMAAKSDVILFGKVVDTKNIGKNEYGFEVVANLFEISDEVIKGNLKIGDKIKIKTYKNLEDSSNFTKNAKYLLFLVKQDNHYTVYNGLQGEWAIRTDGKFGGMGSGKTIKDIKKSLKKGFKQSSKDSVFKM